MENKEIKMSQGSKSDVDWQRQVRTFYDDTSLNNFLRNQRGKPFKITKGPTQIVADGKVVHILEFVGGENPAQD
jgi:hypothetical protein